MEIVVRFIVTNPYNHENSEDLWKLYPEQRLLSATEERKVTEMQSKRVPNSVIVRVVQKETGKQVNHAQTSFQAQNHDELLYIVDAHEGYTEYSNSQRGL